MRNGVVDQSLRESAADLQKGRSEFCLSVAYLRLFHLTQHLVPPDPNREIHLGYLRTFQNPLERQRYHALSDGPISVRRRPILLPPSELRVLFRCHVHVDVRDEVVTSLRSPG